MSSGACLENNQVFTGIAQTLLSFAPQPVPRYLLLRNVLRLPAGDPQLATARAALDGIPAVRALAAAQLADGSWGRFHTQDTKAKSLFPTSEYAIERALALGLDKRSPILARAQGYIEGHLRGEIVWRDRVEKHDDPRLWPFFIAFISAARLAQLGTSNPLLHKFTTFMRALLEAAFPAGVYNPQAEREAQQALSGIPTRTHWALLANVYGVLLLGAAGPLPTELERAWLEYLIHKPGGIFYISGRGVIAEPPALQDPAFSGWLRAVELLSCFPSWRTLAGEALEWLWAQRGADGLWDVGSRASRYLYWPLSETWRRREDRIIDGSVRILALLRRMECA
ncbi:MAG: hypothetical protein LLG44_14680 [Chloroflexi bacterium]|nr:hypothetical protein [Chloroflexota bacterium]